MENKKTYSEPEMEVIYFETEDVITTSGFDFVPGPNELPVNPQ